MEWRGQFSCSIYKFQECACTGPHARTGHSGWVGRVAEWGDAAGHNFSVSPRHQVAINPVIP